MNNEYKALSIAIHKEIEDLHTKFVKQCKKKCYAGEFKVKTFETSECNQPPTTFVYAEYTVGEGAFMGTIELNVAVKHHYMEYLVYTHTHNTVDFVEPLKDKIIAYLKLLGYEDTYKCSYC